MSTEALMTEERGGMEEPLVPSFNVLKQFYALKTELRQRVTG